MTNEPRIESHDPPLQTVRLRVTGWVDVVIPEGDAHDWVERNERRAIELANECSGEVTVISVEVAT